MTHQNLTPKVGHAIMEYCDKYHIEYDWYNVEELFYSSPNDDQSIDLGLNDEDWKKVSHLITEQSIFNKGTAVYYGD